MDTAFRGFRRNGGIRSDRGASDWIKLVFPASTEAVLFKNNIHGRAASFTYSNYLLYDVNILYQSAYVFPHPDKAPPVGLRVMSSA